MGDTNEIQMGAGAQAKQVSAAQTVSQMLIEQQNNYYDARPTLDARFSIPTPPRDFTGREIEINSVVATLAAQGKRAAITSVAGMGGIGKSALAAVVAALVAPRFPDAQLWLDLRGASLEPVRPADAMRQVILAFEPLADLRNANDDQLAQLYRSVLREKRALLVLDNARDNAQVRSLLQANASFLITSRSTITENGTRVVRLDVMSAQDGRAYVISLCPDLSQVEADELCQTCGYLPLALKIASSYLAARPNINPKRYIEQLRQRRLELLRERGDEELNVEAAFAETYDQLALTLQILWRALGIFPAPFWARAAAVVWGLPDELQVEEALGEMLRASLIEFDKEKEKYRLHDLMRDFALARLSVQDRWQTEKRHAGFYLGVTQDAGQLYTQGGENVLKGLNLFEQELPHIRSGRAWAITNIAKDQTAARLGSEYPDAAVYLMQLRLGAKEEIRWFEEAANATRQLNDRESEGYRLGNLGLAYLRLGDGHKAIECDTRALVIARELGNKRSEGEWLCNLGLAHMGLGEISKAIDYYEQALVIAREIGNHRNVEIILGNFGIAYKNVGQAQKP